MPTNKCEKLSDFSLCEIRPYQIEPVSNTKNLVVGMLMALCNPRRGMRMELFVA